MDLAARAACLHGLSSAQYAVSLLVTGFFACSATAGRSRVRIKAQLPYRIRQTLLYSKVSAPVADHWEHGRLLASCHMQYDTGTLVVLKVTHVGSRSAIRCWLVFQMHPCGHLRQALYVACGVLQTIY